MGKGIASIQVLLSMLLLFFSSMLWAASCVDVFPDNETENATAPDVLDVPTWSTSTDFIRKDTTDNFTPGDYFYDDGEMEGNYFLNVSGTTTRLYFKDLVIFGNAELNKNGDPEDLIIVVDGDIDLDGNAIINAIIYATGNISLDGNSDVLGSITAEGSISINGNGDVDYDSDAIDNADFSTLCSGVPSPVAYWSFDTIVDQTVPDDSGNGHDGTLGDNSSSSTDEPLGQCNLYLEYDGSDDFVNVPDHSDLDISEELTVAVWIRPDKIPSSGLMTIVSKDTNFEFHVNSSGEINWWWNNSSNQTREFDSTGTVTIGEWIHVAIVYSKSGGIQTIYLDGVASGTTSYSEDLKNNSNPLQIGNDQGFSGRYFEGDIDEVYVYEAALTQAQVQEVMASTPSFCGQDEASTYYIFDGETWNGTTGEVSDGSGNGADATAANGTLNQESDPAVSGTPGTCQYGEFDGQDDYLVTENSSSELQLGSDYSTGVWVKGSSVGSQNQWAGIYTKTNSLGTTNHWNLQRQDFNDVLIVQHDDVSWDTGITLTQVSDSWHHIGITYSGTTITSYLDGVQVSTSSFTTSTETGFGHLNIGADRTQSSAYVWNGLIDELFIFDSAISSTEMAALYAQTRPCVFAGSCSAADFQDTFSSTNYSNSDGSSDWSANSWVEVNDNDSPSGGRIRITGGELQIRGGGGAQRQIYRSVNISDQSDAQLQFDIRETNAESGDELDLHIYDGSSWVLLETFDGDVSDSTQTYDITAYISSDTRVRFTEDSNNGNDRFYIDDLSFTGNCSAGIDHLEINAASTGSTCNPLAITIRACEDSANPCTTLVDDYDESVDLTISTSRGDWSNNDGQGSVTDVTADDGAASYQFHVDDDGDATLDLSYIYADAIKITATDSANSLSVESSFITFSDNAFVLNWDDTGSSDTVAIAGRDHGLTATYIRKDPSTGACGTVTTYDGDMALLVWFNDNGAYSSVPNAPGLKNKSDLSSVTLPAAQPASSNIDVQFTNGVADLSMTSTDVGQFTVSMLDNSGFVVDELGNPITITGTSSQVTVRPFAFAVDIGGSCVSPSSGDRRSGTNLSLANLGASSDAYKVAGDDFDLNVRAVIYQSGDSDASGNPLAGANLYDNDCLPSFGNENSSSSKTINLSVSAFEPSSGSSGALSVTSISSFSSGEATTSVNYSEVGNFDLGLLLNDYLSTGEGVTGSLEDIGRFYPNHFVVTSSTASLRNATGSWSCGFTYQNQPFEFDGDIEFILEARNKQDSLTNNYGGEGTSDDYFKLATPIAYDVGTDTSYVSILNNTTPINAALSIDLLSATSSILNANNYDGVATIRMGDFFMAYNRGSDQASGAEDLVFNANIDWILSASQLTDTDNACLIDPASCGNHNISNITGAEIRYGRVEVGNNNGSELMNLELPVQVQQWMETSSSSALYSFQVNDEDVCSTSWVAGDITLNSYQGNLASGETTGTLGSFSLGSGVIDLSAPGTGNEGSVNAVLSVDDWLKYDFYGRGNEDPTGTGTFGIYSGRQPIFYLRESYR